MHTLWFLVKLALFIWFLCWVIGHIRYVTVLEATAVAFKYRGRFVYMAMEYAKHCFNASGDVVVGTGPKGYSSNEEGCIDLSYDPQCWCMLRWGGWVFYLSPFVRPAMYTDTNIADSFGDGIHVRLNQITPEPTISMAETKEEDGASVPLDISFVTTMGVMNPYKWLFDSPKNVNGQVGKRLDAILRAWVKSGDEKHAQSVKGNGEALWEELVQDKPTPERPVPLNSGPTIKKMEDDWGLVIVPNSIIAQDIGYDAEYQQAMQAKSKADLLADGEVQATAGRVKKAVAIELGITVAVLEEKLQQKGFSNSPAYKNALAFAKDMVKRDRAGDKGQLTDVRVSNGDGSSIADQGVGLLIGGITAAMKQLSKNNPNNSGGGNDNRGGKNNRGGGNDRNNQKKVLDASGGKPIEDMNDEELRKWVEEQTK